MANLDFNVEPYYDDFNESKHFHKILFKPGYSVQARELTQLQSIIQSQIDRFGSHIFKDGSVVHDGNHSPLYTTAIAIKSFSGYLFAPLCKVNQNGGPNTSGLVPFPSVNSYFILNSG